MKPVLLDACCNAGGAARGYQNAGFHVIGIDISEQCEEEIRLTVSGGNPTWYHKNGFSDCRHGR